jgi:hypothetical protein
MSDIVMAELEKPSPRVRLLLGSGVDTLRLCGDLLHALRKKASGQDHDAFTELVYATSRMGRVRQAFKLAVLGLPAGFEARPPKLRLSENSYNA